MFRKRYANNSSKNIALRLKDLSDYLDPMTNFFEGISIQPELLKRKQSSQVVEDSDLYEAGDSLQSSEHFCNGPPNSFVQRSSD